MTRAADRLVVCGALGKQAMPPGCWYQLVQDGLTASELLVEETADHGDGRVLRFRTTPRQSAATAPSEISQMTSCVGAGLAQREFADRTSHRRGAGTVERNAAARSAIEGQRRCRGAQCRIAPRRSRAPAAAITARCSP